jgi:hypothetical protein
MCLIKIEITIERDIVACQVLFVRLGAQVNASQFLSINGIISLKFNFIKYNKEDDHKRTTHFVF